MPELCNSARQWLNEFVEMFDLRVFFTGGQIVYADYQNEQMKYLYHSDGALKRENGTVVLHGDVKPQDAISNSW